MDFKLKNIWHQLKYQFKLLIQKKIDYNLHPGNGLSHIFLFILTYAKTIKQAIKYLYHHPTLWQRQCKKLYIMLSKLYFSLKNKILSKPVTWELKTKHDNRFRNAYWHSNIVFWFIQQLYLLSEQWVYGIIEKTSLPVLDKQRCHFCCHLAFSTISPTNIPFINPDIIKETWNKFGLNLFQGCIHLLRDLNQWNGYINFNKSSSKYILGKTIAISPGKVVFKTELLELIEYTSENKNIHPEPILIVPSWVNKYYLFDLQQQNSLVKHLQANNYKVFIVSWVNPNMKHANYNLDDYTQHLILSIRKINSWYPNPLHLSSYCLGGTVISILMALNIQQKLNLKIKTASFMATLLDYSHPVPIHNLMGPQQIKFYKHLYQETSIWDGRRLATAFNLLKPNDMIWPYWIHSYLKGKKIATLDCLTWSADLTNMTNSLFNSYSNDMCLQNKLAQGKLKVLNTTIKLSNITYPSYCLAMQDDHIAPWQECIRSMQLIPNCERIIISEGGHFNGIINPISKTKFGFWENPNNFCLSTNTKIQQSWWQDWCKWLQKHSQATTALHVETPKLNHAPGEYVKEPLAELIS